MLSAATGAVRTADERGAPAMMQIRRNCRPLGSITVPNGGMLSISSAPEVPQGDHMCHSVPERGQTALLSGECRLTWTGAGDVPHCDSGVTL